MYYIPLILQIVTFLVAQVITASWDFTKINIVCLLQYYKNYPLPQCVYMFCIYFSTPTNYSISVLGIISRPPPTFENFKEVTS